MKLSRRSCPWVRKTGVCICFPLLPKSLVTQQDRSRFNTVSIGPENNHFLLLLSFLYLRVLRRKIQRTFKIAPAKVPKQCPMNLWFKKNSVTFLTTHSSLTSITSVANWSNPYLFFILTLAEVLGNFHQQSWFPGRLTPLCWLLPPWPSDPPCNVKWSQN